MTTLPLIAVIALAQQAAPAPTSYTADDLARVTKLVSATYSEAAKPGLDGKQPSRESVYDRVAEVAKSALTGIELKRIPAEDAAKWAALFTQARMMEQAVVLEEAASNHLIVQLMFTQADLLHNLMAAGRKDDAWRAVQNTVNRDGSQLGMIGQSMESGARAGKLDKSDPEFVAKCFEYLASRVELGAGNDRPGNRMADFAYVDLSMKALEVLYAAKPDPALLDKMQALKTRFAASTSTNAFGQSPSFRVDEFLIKHTSIGQPAPAVTADKAIGEFPGLAGLKGKVVILDFMAHWCGPCKAALPGLRDLYATYHAKGLEVVSVTSFYGYYGAKQGVKPDDEFELMKGFVKQQGMTWPVVFDAMQATHANYHVGGIPHLVVIDRAGKMQNITVGYTKESEAEVAALVKKLVG